MGFTFCTRALFDMCKKCPNTSLLSPDSDPQRFPPPPLPPFHRLLLRLRLALHIPALSRPLFPSPLSPGCRRIGALVRAPKLLLLGLQGWGAGVCRRRRSLIKDLQEGCQPFYVYCRIVRCDGVAGSQRHVDARRQGCCSKAMPSPSTVAGPGARQRVIARYRQPRAGGIVLSRLAVSCYPGWRYRAIPAGGIVLSRLAV